jgi:hypothetical protein
MSKQGCATIPRSSSDHLRIDDTRSYRFTLTVNVERGHPAYDDPSGPPTQRGER